MPGFRALDAALRRTTERLALELDHPAAAAPDWSELEWDVARGVAAMQGIAVLLAHRLRWSGPPRWQEYLRDQVNHGLRREARIGALITQLDVLLQRERVRALGLKGAALRGLGIYDPGERPMGDVDLLASPDDCDAIGRALAVLGYREIYRTQRHAVFRDRAPDAARGFGEHVDNPLKVELHECVAEPLPASMVDITARLVPLDSRSGLRPYRSRAALMAHLLLHAAGNMRAHAFRLIQLVDLGRLSHQMTGRRVGGFAGWQRGRGALVVGLSTTAAGATLLLRQGTARNSGAAALPCAPGPCSMSRAAIR